MSAWRLNEVSLRFIRCRLRTLCALSQLVDATAGICAGCLHRISIKGSATSFSRY
jgi:hypothetical protein